MIRTGGYYIASGRVVKITELYKGYFTDDNHVEYEADELAEVGLLKDIFERNGFAVELLVNNRSLQRTMELKR